MKRSNECYCRSERMFQDGNVGRESFLKRISDLCGLIKAFCSGV